MTYQDFVEKIIAKTPVRQPIYIRTLGELLCREYGLDCNTARQAVSVAVSRIMKKRRFPDLRRFKNGIYYRTIITPFGEAQIDYNVLTADKYLNPDKGYDAGLNMLNRVGLTTQIARERVIVTNVANNGTRKDRELSVTIKPPKVLVDSTNKKYLQILDILELIPHAPIDIEDPFAVMENLIKAEGLSYKMLLSLAWKYYGQTTVNVLAKVSERG